MTNYEDASALVFNHIEFEVLVTIARLELLVQNLTLAGVATDEILFIISQDIATSGRIFGTFVNGVTKATNLGITSSAQIAELLTYIQEGYQTFKWVTVSKKPCYQCAERAGRIELKEYWEAIGYPRSGFSVCGPNCKCHLVPDKYVGRDTIILD